MASLVGLSPQQQLAFERLLKYPGLIRFLIELIDIYVRIRERTRFKWIAKPLALYICFNRWLAVKITNSVGTMTCAYGFSILAFTGLPGALRDSIQQHSLLPIDMWLSQNYIQLVLLPVIMVGQAIANEQAAQHKEAIVDLHTKADGLMARQAEHGEKIEDLSEQQTALHEHVKEHLPRVRKQPGIRANRISKSIA